MRLTSRGLALLLAATLIGCAGDDGEPAAGDVDRVTGPSIPEQDPVLVAAGEDLYAAHCAECHGVDLRGTDQGPSHLSIVYEPGHHGDGAFFVAAQLGVRQHHWNFGDMPPVPQLQPEELVAIVAFVRENQRLHGFEAYPPP